MEDVGTFYDHLVYFATTWYSLWPFGIFYGHLAYIYIFWVCCTKKNLATLVSTFHSLLSNFSTLPNRELAQRSVLQNLLK
jgi:hypothetical protein